MTKAELQEYLRISKSSVEKLMKQGLPHIKLTRRVLFRKVDVDGWLESKIVKK
jgi:excisionase family DNA binding protein